MNARPARLAVSVLLVGASLSGASLVGCRRGGSGDAFQDPFFPPRAHVPASETMARRQFAIGAREDGMLFDVHFEGTRVNALGRQKLEAMTAVRSGAAPLAVYLNLPTTGRAAGLSAARRGDVETILLAAGLAADQFTLTAGPNPAALGGAAPGLRALDFQRSPTGTDSPGNESTNLPVREGK